MAGEHRAVPDGGQGEAVEKAGLDVTREISARVHRREQRALDERDGYGEGEERVGRKARQHREGLEAGRVHGDEAAVGKMSGGMNEAGCLAVRTTLRRAMLPTW